MTTTQLDEGWTSQRRRLRELDWLMLAAVSLCCLGIVMAVSVQGAQQDGDVLLAVKSQGAKLVAGLVTFLCCATVPLKALKRWAWALFGISTLLVFAAALFGPDWNGAHRWISVGGSSFQPVELARLALVVLAAASIARAGTQIRAFRAGFVRVIGPAIVLAIGLMLQPDHGNALLLVSIVVGMGLAAGVSIWWFGLCLAPLLAVLAVTASKHGYVMERISRFFGEDPPFQVAQSLLAFQSGGLTGAGVGHGWWKLGFVPEAHNDFVFAIVGEELGFLGSATVVGLFTLIGVVGCRLVLQLNDPFHRFVVLGCTLGICAQALINLLVTTGMAPAKGIDLPLVSSGGTNLMASLGAVGLIGNAARSDIAADKQDC